MAGKKSIKMLIGLLLGCALLCATLLAIGRTARAGSDGPLVVTIGAAYNLVVDSNAGSPSTYAPSVATVIGRFCNTGTTTLYNVWGYIGNYNETTPSASTPGIYPARDSADAAFIAQHDALANSGIYSFTHVGGSTGLADASRYIGDLAPGECKVQYWHFTYPQCRNLPSGAPDLPPCEGEATWGNSVKPWDDLWLDFDIWATASGGYRAYDTRRMTMRNEISAMANKIEPNGNPGGAWFNTETDSVLPGEVITTNGIHYEFGNVRFGFDNDGDYAPDYNAWAQPIGDPGFDPSCFRLIRTSGVLTVSRGAGKPDLIIPFQDQLYFMNLPPDNTGVVGDVYYTFLALGGPCNTNLSPYQEVASGYDNEKFNGDYGAGVPPPGSTEPEVTLDKFGNVTVVPGARITYTLAYSNTGNAAAGLPLASMPLVFSDTIPVSTTFTGVVQAQGFTVLYSTDNGKTYTTTQPSPASLVTNIQLWMTDSLAAHTGGVVTFSVQVAATPPITPFIENCADARFGGGAAFTQTCFTTRIQGSYSVGDRVWRDENLNGIQDTGELSITNVTLSLYWDSNRNGLLDNGDRLLTTTVTSNSGAQNYWFTGLFTGTYIVKVGHADPDIPTGYRNTTPLTVAVTLSSTQTSVNWADFGFGPTLSTRKSLVRGGFGDPYIYYNITVQNLRPGGGQTVGNGCRYLTWAEAEASQTSGLNLAKRWVASANALGADGPDGSYAYSDYTNAINQLAGTQFSVRGSGTISSVVAVFSIYVDGTLVNDYASAYLYWNDTQITTTNFAVATLNTFGSGPAQQGLLTWDVTNARTWSWADFAGNLDLQLDTLKVGGKDGATIYFDAMGFQVTAQGACAALNPNDILIAVPLTDTYNTGLLRFVSADPAHTSINTATGVITWANVGPLYPGEAKTVRVTFVPSLTTASNVTNTACSITSVFGDGGLANNACVSATGRITPTGAITGVVWSDMAPTGWQGSTGFDANDYRIPGVTLTLRACLDRNGEIIASPTSGRRCAQQDSNNGTWGMTTTVRTDANGYYEFTGLPNGAYYIELDPTSLPSGFSGTADPNPAGNGSGTSCPPGTCDNLWGSPTVDLVSVLNILDTGAGGEVITNVNFGYSGLAMVYGNVWHDVNGNGARETGEPGLDNGTQGVTVTLYNASTGALVAVTQTDADGNYRFTGLAAGAYTITVNTGTLPGSGWTLTSETGPGTVGEMDSQQRTVTLVAGQISGSYNFGYYQSGSYALGDTLYYDWNGNGTQEPNEEGIPNVTVTLYRDLDGDGLADPSMEPVVMTATTTITGYYLFSNLPAAKYVVVVDTSDSDFPPRVFQTADPDESGVCVICNDQGAANITSSSIYTVDLGYKPYGAGAIGDTVWRDMNGDGVQAGPLETGIANITVWLEADLNNDGTYVRVMTTTTGITGTYLFSNLPDGKYRVVVDSSDPDLPRDTFRYPYIPSTPTTTAPITITNGNTYLDADFGFMPLGAIGDTIYWDANRNGDMDWDEATITHTLVITLVNTSVITTPDGVRYEPGAYLQTQTITNGTYLFTGLVAGTYSVTVGSIPGNPTLTGDPDTNGIPCTELEPGDFFYPFCDGQTSVRIRPGTVFLGADFGYDPPGVIGDFVWRDLNRDGIQDAGEPGIPGVLVTLTDGGTYTTLTDFDGYYSFANLPDDVYTVTFQLPAEVAGTLTPTVSSTNAVTRGVGSVGPLGYVEVSGGKVISINGASCVTCSLYIDSGFVLSGSLYLSGTVFFDAGGTGDGTGDAFTTGDTPYANIPVYLWDSARRLIGTTTTDASGQYTFTNLLPNTVYTVSIDMNSLQLTGLSLTASNGYEVKNYHTVPVGGTSVTDVDFGLYAAIDFGDLPDSYGTRVSGEGAGHITGALYLGSVVDTEGDGQPSNDANGDGLDDSDGITRTLSEIWRAGETVHITATVTGNNGFLVGWFDWNADGDFADSGEMVVFGNVVPGTNALSLVIPSNANTGSRDLYARFRLYDRTQMLYYASTGMTTNGEVEDYRWPPVYPTAVTLLSFTAAWDGDVVRVEWETAMEIDTVGFNVWRSTNPDSGYVQVNDELIPAASPGGMWGGAYAYVDSAVTPGTEYYYRLEEVEVGGARNWYGSASTADDVLPTAVRLRAFAASRGGIAGIGWAAAVLALGAGVLAFVRLRLRRRSS